MIGLAQWYLLKLRTHPLVANCGSALVIMGIGDTMAQVLERYHLDDAVIGESKPNHDHIPIEQRYSFVVMVLYPTLQQTRPRTHKYNIHRQSGGIRQLTQ
jgi:hypothetical protein